MSKKLIISSKKKIFFSWLWVFLCIVSIFLLVPIARAIRNFVETTWNVSLFGYSVLFTVGAAFLFCLYILWFRLKIRAFSNYLWLVTVSVVYIFYTLKLWKKPEEAIHFLEYGLLGFLLYMALRNHFNDKGIYIIAFAIGAFVGIFDEILQWIIPRRVWDFRDLGINALSVGLVQIAIWKGIKPELSGIRLKSKSFRLISCLFSIYLVLFGVCFSNTADRVQIYTEALPFLSFLQREEPMNESKHKHTDPEIGVFYSRLEVEEIYRVDKERADEYSQILREWRQKKYQDFLDYFPGYAQPFLHEMRVHIFRRDERFLQANETKEEKIRKENLFIAYKENLILEKYFGNTLRATPYKWPKKRFERIGKEINAGLFYRSPVSAASPVPLNEKTLWGIILLVIISLIFLNILLSSRKKSP
jgi:VanZ family protein